MDPLHRKVLRDLRRLWGQALAIALVLAAGVATLILGNGAHDALSQTRARYYEDHRFAHVFADLVRAPLSLMDDVRSIDGVLQAEARIRKLARLDLPDQRQAVTLQMVSLPSEGGLNRLFLRSGRLPEAADETVLSQDFATAQGLHAGSILPVIMNGQRRDLTVTGIALSPEFIYAIGPGEMMPDPRRFGLAWLARDALAAAHDLKGAFSNVILRLVPGASEAAVIDRLDRLILPYGGTGATGRAEQTSHAFLDAELAQLGAMSRVLPPIFLLVAALLVHMTMGRMIALEREQIGLFKALGYGPWRIARHYLEFVLVIAGLGVVIGSVAGIWLGAGLARLYARFFSFPYLVFGQGPSDFGLAALVALGAAGAGAVQSLRAVLALPPAVAMSPPAPARYHSHGPSWADWPKLRQTGRMALRHLLHWPLRTATSILGVALAVAILVASLWSFGSIERMIHITFGLAERQDVRLVLTAPGPAQALRDIRHLPGVLIAEPFRLVAARLSNGTRSRRLAIEGRPATAGLSRALSPDLQPMPPPQDGLILTEALASALDLHPGDRVHVAFLEGHRSVVDLPVSGLSLGYVGLGATMEIDALRRATGDPDLVSGANIRLDPAAMGAFLNSAAEAPQIGFLNLTDLTVTRFRDTIAQNIVLMVTVYVTLAAIIAVGMVFNFSRITLSEQGRDLASLRVMGFSPNEVAGVILTELAVVVALAQPLGWGLGYLMGRAMAAAFSSDLYRVPFVMGPEVHATASLAVIAAAAVSVPAIRRRINRLDLIAVLKTRE